MNGVHYFTSGAFGTVIVKTCSNDMHSYKKHHHDELSIGIIEEGETILNVNGTDYRFIAGEAVLISPRVSHECKPVDPSRWKYTMLYLDPAVCRDVHLDILRNNSIKIKGLNKKEFTKIRELIKLLTGGTDSFTKEVELTNTLNDLFSVCDRHILLTDHHHADLVKEYLDTHFLGPIELGELENRFERNKFLIIRDFKRAFNTTPSAYQLQLKVNLGKRLLMENKSILEAALTAGFYDQAHFTREFKKTCGVTPLHYYNSFHSQGVNSIQ